MIACPVELPMSIIHESNGLDDEKTDSSSTHPATSKVRAVSKLSSRHRRKRRGAHEGEGRSAKRNNERIPIPAFTSIPSECYDFGAGRDDGERTLPEREIAPPAPAKTTTPSDCRADTDPCLTRVEAAIVKEACKENYPIQKPDFGHTRATSNSPVILGATATDDPTSLSSENEEIICAKFSSESEEVLDSNGNIQPSTIACVVLSDKAILSTSVAVSESIIEKQSSATATAPTSLPHNNLEQSVDGTLGDVFHHCRLDQAQRGNRDAADAGLAKEKKAQVEMPTFHNNSSSEASKCFVSEESGSSLVMSQAKHRVIDLSNDDIIDISRRMNDNHNRSQYFNSNNTRPSDFVGDSIDGEMSRGTKSVVNGKPSKSDHAKRKRKTDAASSEDKLRSAQKAIEKRNSTRRHRNETLSGPRTVGDASKKKQSKASAGKKKLCSACSNCDCTKGGCADDTPHHFSTTLSGSDARQEQSLINRLQRLEREIAWKEGQRHDIARALKKHQLKMLKTWGDSNSVAQKTRFLADVELSDEVGGSSPKIDSEETVCAKKRVFGKNKTEQPTLTQMVRDQTRDDDPHVELSTVDKDLTGTRVQQMHGSELNNAQHDSTTFDTHADFLSFWTNTDPIQKSTQRYSNMSSFNNALAKYKGMKSTDHWAEATATTLHMEDQGFNALVTLFDESMEKNYSNSSSCGSTLIDNDEDGCLGNDLNLITETITPENKRAANQIETSVRNDHQQLAAIERMCPQWADNIEFAQAQTDPDILQRALQNVKQATVDLESMKDRILRAFMDRHQTLELFAKSLQISRDRLDYKQDEDRRLPHQSGNNQ